MLTTVEIKIDDNGVNAQDYTTSIEDNNGVSIVDTARSVIYKLPNNYYMYVRSVSQVSSTYNFKGSNTEGFNKIRVIPNQLVSQSDIWKIIETPYDSLRILRYPAAAITPYTGGFKKVSKTYSKYILYETSEPEDASDVIELQTISQKVYEDVSNDILTNAYSNSDFTILPDLTKTYTDGGRIFVTFAKTTIPYIGGQAEYIDDTEEYPTLTVLYDQYTTPKGVKVTYYKQPVKFSLMTSVPCELPIDSFEELVSGAVDLYVQYAAGAESRRKQMLKEQQQRNNPSRSRKEEDEE